MTKHSLARRIVCTALIAVCIFASVTITSDDSAIGVSASVADASCRNTVSAETDEKTVVSTKKEDEPDVELDKRLATTHSAEVTFEELEAIIEVLKGNDPTEGKELSERGQNSKNNIAISLIYLLRNAKAVKDVRLAISLHERVLFINHLFSEDPMAFQATINRINASESLEQVVDYVKDTFPQWNLDSDLVYRFMMAVRRKIR